MASSLWKRGADSLKNGIVLGALLGAAIIWGGKVYGWIEGIVPSNLLILGSWSLPLYILGIGALIGYIVDRV